ncbi:hypothetical protein ACJIZ3_024314 [Penstemon smallii]|uniref:C2 NT-type domain-containing protein n=1 Tax=Penstemon smallii TaxID=265156 RepID=A0ABD3TTI8_9LAMI
MFKLQRPSNRPSKSKESLDFKFSNFQALQVPKGWERLFVSLISVETGKTIAKLGKALVKNGTCQWTETLSESFLIFRDDSSKEFEQSLIKIVVSTGSTRSSTLGEATINVAHYTSSRVSAAFSQPPTKCSYGTILQVKIQCLTPRSKIRNEEPKYQTSQEKDTNHDLGSQSNRSDYSNDSQDQATTSRPLKSDSKETSQSASGTNSFGSIDGSIRRELLSRKNAFKSEEYDSNEIQVGGSFDGSQIHDNNSIDNESPLNQFGSSRNLLEAAEDTIEELRAEAKMWERNARKLMIDLDMSKKEFSDLSKNQAGLVIELSASRAEYASMKQESEMVKRELEKLTTKQANQEDPTFQSERLIQMQNVLENEIKYQQDMNANLGQQLKCTQESNIELVSVLQELEETIEKQKVEIENLSSLKLDFKDLENSIAKVQSLEEALRDKCNELENERKSNNELLYKISVKDGEIAGLEAKLSSNVDDENDLIREIESMKEKIRKLEKDCAELTDENLELLIKLKDSSKTDFRKCASFDSMSSENLTNSPSDDSEVTDPYKFQEHEEAKVKSEEKYADIVKELDGTRSEVDLIKASLLSKEEEIELLLRSKTELEIEVSELQQRSSNLEKNVELVLREKNIVSERMENLEREKHELESNLSVSEDEIQKLNVEMDIQIFCLKQKSGEIENQRLETLEECQYLKAENRNLQTSATSLIEDNVKLQNSNLELQRENQEVTKNELDAIQLESESRIRELICQLAGLQKSYDRLMADHERVLKSLANYKKSEEKLKTDINDLELKLTISDYEREQLTKEMGVLKVQLQNISHLQDEISILKCELEQCRLDYEELNAEKVSLSEKILSLNNGMSEFEECKSEKLALEEKLLQMENELAVKEILQTQNSDLQNELNKIKRANTQFQQKIYGLEEEKEECLKKAQSLEQDVESMKGAYDHNLLENEVAGNNNDGKVVAREKYERTKSSFETELRDLRDRYLKMSLKYAEVEAQREDLVMKLKASRSGKRWFG